MAYKSARGTGKPVARAGKPKVEIDPDAPTVSVLYKWGDNGGAGPYTSFSVRVGGAEVMLITSDGKLTIAGNLAHSHETYSALMAVVNPGLRLTVETGENDADEWRLVRTSLRVSGEVAGVLGESDLVIENAFPAAKWEDKVRPMLYGLPTDAPLHEAYLRPALQQASAPAPAPPATRPYSGGPSAGYGRPKPPPAAAMGMGSMMMAPNMMAQMAQMNMMQMAMGGG